MKSMKLTALIIAFALCLSLAACGSADQDTAISQPAAQAHDDIAQEETGGASQDLESDPSRSLVVFFSRTGEQYNVGVIDKGNTAIVAEMIAEKTGADLFEIVPADDHYPVTYDELIEVAKAEKNSKARPAYSGEVPDLSEYDVIYIGAPVWWGDWPMIMYTFFEENASSLSGKTLAPFSTHEGSGLSGFDKRLASSCPGSTVLDGLAIRGSDAQNKQDSVRSSVEKWIADLDI